MINIFSHGRLCKVDLILKSVCVYVPNLDDWFGLIPCYTRWQKLVVLGSSEGNLLAIGLEIRGSLCLQKIEI